MENEPHLFFEGIASSRYARSAPAMRRPAPRRAAPVSVDPNGADFYPWLFRRAGLDVANYRGTSLARRINACFRAVGARDAEEARRRIESDPSLLQPAIDAVLLGVTEFTRDEAVFDLLRTTVLRTFPERPAPIRIWSAACSDGQELYSVGILLADAGLLDRCELWGTDCRPEAIERARAGVFAVESVDKLSVAIRSRYFSSEGRVARASAELCRAMRWKVADLFAGPERGPWDLILWRNMAIYLMPDAADRLWRAIVQELAPGGHLVVGKADHPPAELGLRRVAACVYQRMS